MSNIIERVRNLERQTTNQGTEESPEGTSVATKNYPNYIVPAGETLTVPAGRTLHTGGGLVGSTSGSINEKTTGDEINVVKSGACEGFEKPAIPIQIYGLSSEGSLPTDIVTGFTTSNIKQITVGMSTISIAPAAFPPGTTVSSVNITDTKIRMSNTTPSSFINASIFFEKTERMGVNWEGIPWFGDGEPARHSVRLETISWGSSVTGPSYLLRPFNAGEISGKTAWCHFIRNEDCQHMLGSKVSASALILPDDDVALAILEWRGDVDDRPQNIVTDWTTTPPTFVSDLHLIDKTTLPDPNRRFKLEGVQLTDMFVNLMVVIYTLTNETGIIQTTQVQLERGTTSTAYRRYGE
jgi:hypothetical protein